MEDFLIDEKTIKTVQKALAAYVEHVDEDCAHDGCLCTYPGSQSCSQWIEDALHCFDTSLRESPSKEKIR